MNCKNPGQVELNGQILENVDEHVYLGTIISSNGERVAEMNSRMMKANSVSNEIEQICKTPELSSIRLWYVKLLSTACLDSMLKFGSALWNVTKLKSTEVKLNRIKPNLLKRVLQVPNATPSTAIQFEFGINDLILDVLLEKVVLAVKILQCEGDRITKQILAAMLEKNVPGFCSELREACVILDVSIDDLMQEVNVRETLKQKIIKIQGAELLKRMLVSSKMDRIITSGYIYDGKMMKYLTELNFKQARAIFMSRYRMWPTKANYPGRWKGTDCNICGLKDNDEHIVLCPGYSDIVGEKFDFNVFWDKGILEDTEKLKVIADVVVILLERMEKVQNLE